MQIPQTLANEMLQQIEDPKARQLYGGILSGDIGAQVHCNSKTCKGRVIAHIRGDGIVTETPPVIDKSGKFGLYSSGLEGSRVRLDGVLGFRCYCGNNSVLCKEEDGVITPAMPTREQVQNILVKINNRKGVQYIAKNGKMDIDGFTIEELKV